ncbi:MAG: hypothetical protein Q8K60_01725 [Parachlamydiaceae bacterium]|nr:hypothetical protein [Parachlamydiaceae bacterium]
MTIKLHSKNIFEVISLPQEELKIENKSVSTSQKYTHLFKKAFEAEDIKNQKKNWVFYPILASLKREFEGILFDPKLEKKQQINQRHGYLWECVDRIPHKNGYFINKFRYKNLHSLDQQRLNKENEPALEHTWNVVQSIFQKNTWRDLCFRIEKTNNDCFFYAPDTQLLQIQWELLREKYPYLPPFDLADSEGIANDEDYVFSHIQQNGLISNGKEASHDLHIHVGQYLEPILNSLSPLQKNSSQIIDPNKMRPMRHSIDKIYNRIKKSNKLLIIRPKEIRKQLLTIYRRIEIGKYLLSEKKLSRFLSIDQTKLKFFEKHQEKFTMVLGYFADLFSARPDYLPSEEFCQDIYMEIWNGVEIQNYTKKRFGELKFEEKKTLKSMWKFLIKIEFLFDCEFFLKNRSDNERNVLSPLSKTKKAAFIIFPAICDLYPNENPQEIAIGLSQIDSKEEFYQFIKKNDKEDDFFKEVLGRFKAKELNVLNGFNEVRCLIQNVHPLKIAKLVSKLKMFFSEQAAVALMNILHEYNFSSSEILDFSNELLIKGKKWKYFFDDVITLMKRENPYELLKKLENVKNVEGHVKIAVASPHLNFEEICEIQKK